VGVFSNLVLFAIYSFLLRAGTDLVELQTFMFVAVATNSLFYVFSIKSLRKNIWHENLMENKFLLIAVGLGFLLTWASMYVPVLKNLLGTVPLPLNEVVILMVLGMMTVLMIELVKGMYSKFSRES